uniref:Uncharacterized protein n=1 Tax=Physcomitrium patens TaxID=3218 RepID=A0A2K1IZC9_PHYPA|nr:hypothetical protein PHYPA_024455 [Physcomitrium patens]
MEGRGVEETEGRGGERTGEGLRRSTSPISRDHLATGSSSSLEYLHTSCILPRAKTLAGQRGWGQGDTSSKAVFWPPPSTPPLPFSHASPPLLSSFLPTHARLRVFPPLPSTWVGLRASGFRLIDSCKNWRTGHRYVQLFDEFGPIMLMLQSNLHFMATVWAQLPCQKT